MKNMKTIKLATIVLSIILVLVALFTATYALFTNEVTSTAPNSYTTGLLDIKAISKTENISPASTLPMSDEAGESSTPYKFSISNTGNVDCIFDLKLLSSGGDTEISKRLIKVKIDNNETTTLDKLLNGTVKDDLILMAGDSMEIEVRVWLSEEATNDQIGKTFNGRIVVDGEAFYESAPLVEHITNLYAPTVTETNGGESYNLDVINYLMKDTDENIRYFGATPNNYIKFNCNKYPETECETWRIIGVFDNKLKLIKNSELDLYSFDYDYNDDQTSTTYSNDWKNASLNNLLNGAYLNNQDTTYYNYSSSGPVKKDIKFKSNKTGINDSTRGLIAEVIYGLGGYPGGTPNVYPSEIYELEKNGNTSEAKITLPYLSDYLFSSDIRQCKVYASEYNVVSECKTSNWMKNILGPNTTTYGLTLTPVTSATTHLFIAGDGVAITRARSAIGIFPVLYLSSDAIRYSGNGSYENPYKIINSKISYNK